MIKNTNSKMAKYTQLSTAEPEKTKMNYSNHQNKNGFTEIEITWRVISGEGEEKNGEKVQVIRNISGQYKIDRGRLRIV